MKHHSRLMAFSNQCWLGLPIGCFLSAWVALVASRSQQHGRTKKRPPTLEGASGQFCNMEHRCRVIDFGAADKENAKSRESIYGSTATVNRSLPADYASEVVSIFLYTGRPLFRGSPNQSTPLELVKRRTGTSRSSRVSDRKALHWSCPPVLPPQTPPQCRHFLCFRRGALGGAFSSTVTSFCLLSRHWLSASASCARAVNKLTTAKNTARITPGVPTTGNPLSRTLPQATIALFEVGARAGRHVGRRTLPRLTSLSSPAISFLENGRLGAWGGWWPCGNR